MTYDVCRHIFIVASTLCGLALLLSVFIFVRYIIPHKTDKNTSDVQRPKAHYRNPYSASKKQRGEPVSTYIPKNDGYAHNGYANCNPVLSMMNTQELLKDEDAFCRNVGCNFSSSQTEELSNKSEDYIFDIEYEITFIHTDEIITA